MLLVGSVPGEWCHHQSVCQGHVADLERLEEFGGRHCRRVWCLVDTAKGDSQGTGLDILIEGLICCRNC